MNTQLLHKKKIIKVATNLIKDKYYYIYEVSDSLKSSDDEFSEINDDTDFCYGKFDHFDRRYNVFKNVKCPNDEYNYETKRFSIINNLFLEEEKNCCCKILDGKSKRRRRIRKTRVKKIRSKRKSKSPKKK